MAIFNACVTTTDDIGREWKYYTRVRAVSMNHAINKARNVIENAMGEDSHRASVWGCDLQEETTIQLTGKNGRIIGIGKGRGDIGFPHSREIVIKDGKWDSMSDLDMSTHEWVSYKLCGR